MKEKRSLRMKIEEDEGRKKAFERLVQWELHGGGGGIRMLENQNAVL